MHFFFGLLTALSKRNFADFIAQFVAAVPGIAINVDDGTVVADVDNVMTWTNGQRLTIGGLPDRFYVVATDVAQRAVLVARGAQHATLRTNSVDVDNFVWLAGEPPAELMKFGEMRLRFQVRLLCFDLSSDVSLTF